MPGPAAGRARAAPAARRRAAPQPVAEVEVGHQPIGRGHERLAPDAEAVPGKELVQQLERVAGDRVDDQPLVGERRGADGCHPDRAPDPGDHGVQHQAQVGHLHMRAVVEGVRAAAEGRGRGHIDDGELVSRLEPCEVVQHPLVPLIPPQRSDQLMQRRMDRCQDEQRVDPPAVHGRQRPLEVALWLGGDGRLGELGLGLLGGRLDAHPQAAPASTLGSPKSPYARPPSGVNSPGARRSVLTTGGTPRMSARTDRTEARVVCQDSIVHRSDNESEFWSEEGSTEPTAACGTGWRGWPGPGTGTR